MLILTPRIRIPREEFAFTFARSGGPGGQNVNKVSSKVLLRWNPGASPSLPSEVKARFLEQQRHRLTSDGELLIISQKTRDQAKNIEDCCAKLAELIRPALFAPKVRKASKPTRGQKEKRLRSKKHTGQKKAGRRPIREE
jgi:ribosome-associated protein